MKRTPYRPWVSEHLICAARLQRIKSSYFTWDEASWRRVCLKYDSFDTIPWDIAPILIRILLTRGLKDVEVARRLGYVGENTIYEARKAHRIPKNYRAQIREKMGLSKS